LINESRIIDEKGVVMKKSSTIGLLAATALLMAAMSSHAAAPRKINYQGYLTNPAGAPLTGTYSMVFSLCDAATAGTCPWTETQNVAIDKGIFNVSLGAVTSLTLTFNIPYYLDIQVNGEQMSARQPLTSVGYAFSATTVATDTTNLFIGYQSGLANTTGQRNVYIGDQTAYNNQTGNDNVFLGYASGHNTTGSGNVFLGNQAGYYVTGSNRLFIDNSSTNSPLIHGEFDNNRVVINGNSSNNINNRTFFVNGSAGGTGAWWNDSDERLKKNIVTIPDALSKVLNLRGVNFEWKDPNSSENGTKMGFIAQEAEKLIPEVVSNEGGTYSMQYAPVTAVLVEAIKEQQKQIESLKAELEAIKALLKK
jgi:hypothetical protein